MVYDAQNYWVFGLCPSSGILETSKHFGNWICFRPQVRVEKTPTQLCPLESANLNHCNAIRIVIEQAHAWNYNIDHALGFVG
jgi:hypothetical protein